MKKLTSMLLATIALTLATSAMADLQSCEHMQNNLLIIWLNQY